MSKNCAQDGGECLSTQTIDARQNTVLTKTTTVDSAPARGNYTHYLIFNINYLVYHSYVFSTYCIKCRQYVGDHYKFCL